MTRCLKINFVSTQPGILSLDFSALPSMLTVDDKAKLLKAIYEVAYRCGFDQVIADQVLLDNKPQGD